MGDRTSIPVDGDVAEQLRAHKGKYESPTDGRPHQHPG